MKLKVYPNFETNLSFYLSRLLDKEIFLIRKSPSACPTPYLYPLQFLESRRSKTP
jgi:hypothetical protein